MFDFLKRKKKKRDVSMECVYAGPEEMARRTGRTVPEKKAQIEGVYAGPADVEIEEVYAGPGMMGETGWEGTEEPEVSQETPKEGPSDDSSEAPTVELPKIPPYSGKITGPREPVMGAVYAGPTAFGNLPRPEPVSPDPEIQQPNPAPMMFVYAGPDYFRNRQAFAQVRPGLGIEPGLPYPQNYAEAGQEASGWREPEAGEATRFCPECGRKVPEAVKTCLCGYRFEDEDPIQEENTGNPDEPFEAVYAGPEYFGGGQA